MTSFSSFSNELEKIAFNRADAAKVLSIAKKIRTIPSSTNTGGIAASKGKGRWLSDMKRYWRQYTEPEEAERRIRGLWNQMEDKPYIHTGSIEYGDLNGKQKAMRKAISYGHELDETRVRSGFAAKPFGHDSPDVIFREHNRVVTLPEGYEELKAHMQKTRARGGESAALFPNGIEYGKGQRLSRHARKRLTEYLERKAVAGGIG